MFRQNHFFRVHKKNHILNIFRSHIIKIFHSWTCFTLQHDSQFSLEAVDYTHLLCLHNRNINFKFETSVFMKPEISPSNWREGRIIMMSSVHEYKNKTCAALTEKHGVNKFLMFCIYCDDPCGRSKFLPYNLYYYK